MDFVDPRLLRKVNLPPALGPAQFPDSLACRHADVSCHASMIELAFALYLVHTLSGIEKENQVNRISAILLLACSVVCFAQAPQIKSGSAVYIEPMDGYETYLAAAFVQKHLPLLMVADKDKADYVIRSTVSQNVPSTPQVVVHNTATATVNEGDNGNNQAWNQGWASGQQAAARSAARRAALGSTSVSISVVDVHSSQVVFAYSVDKGGTTHQEESTAEACAKHLKEFIEKPKK